MTLPAFATECDRLQLSLDISCLKSAQQQTTRTMLLPSIGGTDRRTPDRYTDPVRHVGSVNN